MGTFVILSYEECDRSLTAKLLAGKNVGLEYEQKIKTSKPQGFYLGPHQTSDKIFLKDWTKRLYYTIYITSSDKSLVTRENILWPLPERKWWFNEVSQDEERGDLLTINDKDVEGGIEVDVKFPETKEGSNQTPPFFRLSWWQGGIEVDVKFPGTKKTKPIISKEGQNQKLPCFFRLFGCKSA